VHGDYPGNVDPATRYYLTQFIVRDTSWVPGRDTLIKNTIIYDSKKRISRCVSAYYEGNASFQTSPVYTHDFIYEYNSNADSLPIRLTDTYTDLINPAANWTETLYLWYDSARVIKDSITSHYGYKEVTEFTKLSDTTFRSITTNTTRSSPDTAFSWIKKLNNDVTYEKDSFQVNLPPFPPFWSVRVHEMEYDLGFNAVNRLFLPYMTPFRHTGIDYFYMFYDFAFSGTHNPLNYSVNNSLRAVWTNIYNSDGLPILAYMIDTRKVFYKYTVY